VARGNGLHMNVRIASHPAIDSPVARENGRAAQPPLLHRAVHDRVNIRFVVVARQRSNRCLSGRAAGPDESLPGSAHAGPGWPRPNLAASARKVPFPLPDTASEPLARLAQGRRLRTRTRTLAIEGVLREYELSDEEIGLGRVGGGMDGGIDGFYSFLDGVLLDEDSEVLADEFKPAQVRRNVDLEVWIVQAKRETSFTETTFDKWNSSLGRLFDLTMSDIDLEALYSKELIGRVRIFTEAWRRLGIRSPRIAIRIHYVTRGEPDTAGQPVQTKRSDLESRVGALVHGAHVESD
jgi:hypothetical protein